MLLSLSAVFTARLGWAKACCKSSAVCAVVADAVAATQGIALLRFSLSLTASHSY